MEKQEEAKRVKNIYEKMAEIQSMNIQILKDKAAHGYSYATLDQIMDKLNPILKENGLFVWHKIDYCEKQNCQYLQSFIVDLDDSDKNLNCVTYLDGTITLPGQNKVMVIGSLITYYRRYHVTSMFGLTTETDTDAGGAVKDGAKAKGGRSVETAGVGEKTVDFVGIFTNMIAKKTKDIVEKQLENYKSKMSEEQLNEVNYLINNMK